MTIFRFVVPIIALTAAFMPMSPAWVEDTYSQALYPWLQHVLTSLSNRIPFALFDLLVVAGILWIGWQGRAWIRAPRGGRLRAFGAACARALVLGAAGYLIFLTTWGCNYRRESLRTTLQYSKDRVTSERARALARESVRRLNALNVSAHRSGWPTFERIGASLAPPFHELQAMMGLRAPIVPARPKSTLFGPYFRSAAIDGMIDPFFLETLVNREVLPYERPFVVAHEWAHLAGFADEGEASFIGWLACLRGGPDSQYSAWLFLGPYLWNALSPSDRDDVLQTLAEGPRQDLRAVAARLARAQPRVSRYARAVYDRYLKANRVASGVASYGTVIDLALGIELERYLIQPAAGSRQFNHPVPPPHLPWCDRSVPGGRDPRRAEASSSARC